MSLGYHINMDNTQYRASRIPAEVILEQARDLMADASTDSDGLAHYLQCLLHYNGYSHSQDPEVVELKDIIMKLKHQEGHLDEIIQEIDEEEFKQKIIDYYMPEQLIKAILDHGEIPDESMETQIGVGFIDIADYTFISKFLSPKENQILLNGLYTSFDIVLKKRGGYLNKIEGDSIMFHYGGLTDPALKQMTPTQLKTHISGELFYTCVEMQRVCYMFNDADPALLESTDDIDNRKTIKKAFSIISSMRNDDLISTSFNALFQIRIRIGANMGEVSIGNFGPPGGKRLDVIGLPVIDAKRMESTAPIGGLRISHDFYEILEETGIVDAYYEDFITKAQQESGYYQDIKKAELFRYSEVILKDKKNVIFKSHSVQVNPLLPEALLNQARLLLSKGEKGVDRILELLQYYRGNRQIMQAMEDLFESQGIYIRKAEIVKLMFPKKYNEYLEALDGDESMLRRKMESEHSLFGLFKTFGQYQDIVKEDLPVNNESATFTDYESFINQERDRIQLNYDNKAKAIMRRNYFFNIIYPTVFTMIRASLLEYQYDREHVQEAEELLELSET